MGGNFIYPLLMNDCIKVDLTGFKAIPNQRQPSSEKRGDIFGLDYKTEVLSFF